MVRRELQRVDTSGASFVGHIVEGDTAGATTSVGQRVAGASITHPADTEFVLARPDFIFPIEDDCDDALAALALYGGLAVYAADEAMEATHGPIGITGSGVLAHVVASIVIAQGGDIAHNRGEEPFASAKLRGGGPGHSDVWIETAPSASPRRIRARTVIGLAVPLQSVQRAWPHVERRLAADVGDVVRGGQQIVDLFYDDAEPDWPACLEPNRIARYLDLVRRGKIVTGALPQPIEMPPRPDAEPLSQQLESARSPDKSIFFTRFSDTAAAPVSRRLDLHQRTSHGARKTVSVVGAGEWPLGMILRQIIRDERVSLRGACDRRPEVLHLARQALPFDFLTTSYDDLLTDDATDLIVVAPFHGAHAPLAAAALRAGKHCFLEKPAAVDREQLDSLVEAATHARGFLYVGYNRRFAPATEILVRHLRDEDGPLTADIVVHGVPLPPNHWYFWPSNGNRIISNMCHFIDYVLTLAAPANPVRVTATPSLVGRPDEDITIALAFDDGSIASITYTKRGTDRRPIYYQSYHVMKGAVTAVIEDFARLTVHRKKRRVASWRGAVDLGHRRQMAVLANALVGDGASPVSLESTITSARTVLAAAESARLGASVDIGLADQRADLSMID
jgi:predicted dehydrogenase